MLIFFEVWAAVATVLAVYFYSMYRKVNHTGLRLFAFMRIELGYSMERLDTELRAFENKILEGAN